MGNNQKKQNGKQNRGANKEDAAKKRGGKKKSKRLVAILLLAVLGIIVAALWPKSSAICYDGTADRAAFSVTLGKHAAYGIKSDNQYNGKIVFKTDKTKTMYVAEASMSEEEILHIQENGFPGWESSDKVFPFVDGSATLSAISESRVESRLLMTLILEPPGGESLTYDIEITRVSDNGNAEINQIELKNFSAEPVIKLSSPCDINMKGTTKMIPAGLYRITGCKSITFFAVPGGPEDSENGYSPQLNNSLEHFQFTNAEKGTFEVTYFSETEFSEVGRVEVEGQAQAAKLLELTIGDIGQYPIPVKIYGRVGELKIAGTSRYLSAGQMLMQIFPELLVACLIAAISFLAKEALGLKDND